MKYYRVRQTSFRFIRVTASLQREWPFLTPLVASESGLSRRRKLDALAGSSPSSGEWPLSGSLSLPLPGAARQPNGAAAARTSLACRAAGRSLLGTSSISSPERYCRALPTAASASCSSLLPRRLRLSSLPIGQLILWADARAPLKCACDTGGERRLNSNRIPIGSESGGRARVGANAPGSCGSTAQ